VLNDFFFRRHLDEDEEILTVVHKHWLIGFKFLWLPTLIFIAVWSVLYFVRTEYVIYGIALGAGGVGIWWIRNFMDYYLDAWIITTKGVIDLEWHGWFHRKSARVLYSDVQGIGYEINGIWGTLFGYGEMALEKISTGTSINMPYVSRPRRIESVVLQAMESYMLQKNLKDAKTVQGILAEFVASSLQKQSAEAQAHAKLPKKK
jgi:hypothetical protein